MRTVIVSFGPGAVGLVGVLRAPGHRRLPHQQPDPAREDFRGGADIIARFRECGRFAYANNLRLSFHPDQFVVLNSPTPLTLTHSLAELNYQAEVAEWVGADTINLHGGGAYGDRPRPWAL